MLIKILLVLAVIVIAFLIVVTLQPAEYRVVRSTTISAPPAAVFAQVNDFHNWEAWSPWAKLDPAAKNTFAGAPAGVGAIFSWDGNSKVGAGQMTLADSQPDSLIKIKLDFIKPFPSTAIAEFTFKPEGNQTAVTWAMSGQKNFMSKAFCLFMNMDKMLGGEFEKGLANLKSVTETATKK
ncbi:MAG: polyketide cyclase [Pedosphaera sp.]|nr:polyketide cyclase [Pedosphaera sp.]